MSEIIKTHDDDVIFSYESLKEFIRLIQRQGINNLAIFSVSKLLEDGWDSIKTKDGKNSEFEEQELLARKGCIVFVRYSYGWQSGFVTEEGTETPIQPLKSKNEVSGRHTFIKTISDVIVYQGSIKSAIQPENNIDIDSNTLLDGTENQNGTFIITIDNIQYSIKIKGFDDDGNYIGTVKQSGLDSDTQAHFLRGDGQWTNELGGNFLPTSNDTFTLGSATKKWKYIYGTVDKAKHDINGKEIAPNYCAGLRASSNGAQLTLQLLNGNGGTLGTAVTVSTQDTKNTAGSSQTSKKIYLVGAPSQSSTGVVTYSHSSVYTTTAGYLYAVRTYNAVFNDYAEYRTTINLEPGRVVQDNDDGSLSCTEKRLIPGAQIISDTFGHSMGFNEQNQTPLAVAGRVLAYPYQSRENYHAGMAVCSAPNGTVDIMTREEIKEYPDCIVGIVSEIPQYDTWGSDNVVVNNRIWIKV